VSAEENERRQRQEEARKIADSFAREALVAVLQHVKATAISEEMGIAESDLSDMASGARLVQYRIFFCDCVRSCEAASIAAARAITNSSTARLSVKRTARVTRAEVAEAYLQILIETGMVKYMAADAAVRLGTDVDGLMLGLHAVEEGGDGEPVDR
jgi:hypothetical protein